MSWDDIYNYVLPFVAIQMYLFCLLYVVLTKRALASAFPYLVAVLVAKIFFLACYLVDILLIKDVHTAKLIHLRLGVLMTIGFPALTIVVAKFSRFRLSGSRTIALFLFGGLLTFAYIFFNSLAWRTSFGDHSLYFTEWLPNFRHGSLLGQIFASAAALLLVIVPCVLSLLGYKKSSPKNVAFISSAALFAVLFVIGIVFRIWPIYYIGSLACALIFFVAIYIEINFLNQTTSVIKEELRKRVNKGQSGGRVTDLIENLENFSEGDIELYKLRIREVLSVLVDDTIASGGDAKILLERNNENLKKIEYAESAQVLTKITENEAREISNLIEDIPKQRRREVVEQAKGYISENLDSELTIDLIAKSLFVSRSYMTTAFKELEKMTINQYVTQIRIEVAKPLLKYKKVTDVAFTVGFNNSNYFSTVFKKITGMSPKDYQKKLQKE